MPYSYYESQPSRLAQTVDKAGFLSFGKPALSFFKSEMKQI